MITPLQKKNSKHTQFGRQKSIQQKFQWFYIVPLEEKIVGKKERKKETRTHTHTAKHIVNEWTLCDRVLICKKRQQVNNENDKFM